MKKAICLFIVVLMIFSLFGCEEEQVQTEDAVFDFRYEISKTLCFPGDKVEIKGYVENVSDTVYKYTGCSGDYFPHVSLYPVLEDGSLGEPVEQSNYIVLPDDVVDRSIKKGDVGSYAFEFIIPEGEVGAYTAVLSFAGQKKEFPEVLRVINAAEQNKSDDYLYSGTVVSSGGYGINPIRTLVWTSEYVDGLENVTGDGDGFYRLQSDPETDTNRFPHIVLTGEIGIAPADDVTKYESIMVCPADDLNDLKSVDGIEALSKLPAGEYVVVYREFTDTRCGDESIKDYWTGCMECVFKLTVFGVDAPNYGYSPTLIRSGDKEINPIKLYLSTTTYSENKITHDDGGGSWLFFQYKPDPDSFPTLTLKDKLTVYPPVNCYIGYINVYDTELDPLKLSVKSFSDLEALSAGEYVIVYFEQYDTRGCIPDEITEYSITEYESVFKLIVQER